MAVKKREWTTEDSASLYKLRDWGTGYFGVNPKGNVVCHPYREGAAAIDVKDVVEDVVSRGIKLPVLLRFQDILRDRVVEFNKMFERAIDEHKYGGRYFGVFPVKVNQLREVVEEILDAGEPYLVGLEAGSKPELLAVLAMNSQGCLTIVNGYKDESMMRLACVGMKLGKQVVVVIEKLSELQMLLDVSKEMGIQPLIGLRCRMQTEGSGRWKSSGGYRAKFGLSTPAILSAVRTLEDAGKIDSLRLVHFHVGSQVTDIKTIKDAVKEGTRVYAKLRKMGVPIEYVDCGGGLGVDYEGSKSQNDYSVNYDTEEYVRDIVYSIQEVCTQEEVPEPHIVTETGRAMVAHHSILVANVFDRIEAGSALMDLEESDEENRVVGEMRDIINALTRKNLTESLNDGRERLEEAKSMFKLGFLALEDKAKVEALFWNLCRGIRALASKKVSKDVKEMLETLHDQYLMNFSLFLSLPDSWAIDHVFPVMPLHRLKEEPTRQASLADMTCDSDGKISNFVCARESASTLPVHELKGRPYYFGVFLVGAYQATMGDIHNLFGRVNEVHVFYDEEEPGDYYLEEIIPGQTVRDVLDSIQYNENDLVRLIRAAVDARVKAGKLKPREGVDLLVYYEFVLRQYTYIEHNGKGPSSSPSSGTSEESAEPPAPLQT